MISKNLQVLAQHLVNVCLYSQCEQRETKITGGPKMVKPVFTIATPMVSEKYYLITFKPKRTTCP